jgi:FxsC-like protein
VVKLFYDLRESVIRHSDLPVAGAKYAGFLDQEQRHDGDAPSWRLAQALGTCRVFVPLVSRRYFASEHSGREWFAFTRRVVNSGIYARVGAKSLIPALWAPMEKGDLPAAAQMIRFNHAAFGEVYAEHGFYGIMKLARFQDAYKAAVDGLARSIVRAAEEPPASEAITDFASLPSAFGPAGGRPLRITIVAPRRCELPHGHDACGWNAFASEGMRRLANHAAGLARALGYHPEVGDLSEHRDELLRTGPPSSPDVLIVAAQATTLEPYADLLRRIDAANKPWIQVVVTWPSAAAENAESADNGKNGKSAAVSDELRSARTGTPGHELAVRRALSPATVRVVSTLGDFSEALPDVIMIAARQYLKYARAFPPPGKSQVERPRLNLSLPDLSNTELPGA